MNSTPAIAFSAYSVTGKTTLIERLIVRLKTMGCVSPSSSSGSGPFGKTCIWSTMWT